jgi:hypothetical protein
MSEQLASRTDFHDDDLGPQLLAIKSGARGSLRHLLVLVGPRDRVVDVRGNSLIVRGGLNDGLTPSEAFACVAGARRGLGETVLHTLRLSRSAYGVPEPSRPSGFNVLARAMRARQPGIVFARAAAIGEIDPLTDVDSRLFVGLPATGRQ